MEPPIIIMLLVLALGLLYLWSREQELERENRYLKELIRGGNTSPNSGLGCLATLLVTMVILVFFFDKLLPLLDKLLLAY